MESLEDRIWDWAFDKLEDGDVILTKPLEQTEMIEEFAEFIDFILKWADDDLFNFESHQVPSYYLKECELWSIFNNIKIVGLYYSEFKDEEYERIFRNIFNEYMFIASGAKKEMEELEEVIPEVSTIERKSTRI